MYWNLNINFDWNIIEIEITKYKHSTELSCNVPTLPVGLSDTQIGVCSVYVFMYGLRRLSRVEVRIHARNMYSPGLSYAYLLGFWPTHDLHLRIIYPLPTGCLPITYWEVN